MSPDEIAKTNERLGCKPHGLILCSECERESTIATLRAELEAARADTKRLDWIDSEHADISFTPSDSVVPYFAAENGVQTRRGEGATVRQAIDAALASEGAAS